MKKPTDIINDPRITAAIAHSEAVRAQLKRQDAMEALRKMADTPDADKRELFAATMKVDPYIVRNQHPNRKQRRAHFAKLRHELKGRPK